jgi:hypothetical protein
MVYWLRFPMMQKYDYQEVSKPSDNGRTALQKRIFKNIFSLDFLPICRVPETLRHDRRTAFPIFFSLLVSFFDIFQKKSELFIHIYFFI